ncbi:hypothetical protein B484DRAFT_458878 [Ochromonadaceae sp. CCMP2298]|nr:hypothetical protein B484DRAFT_458878 [Ochromonadaceae sp. CCMP2298]
MCYVLCAMCYVLCAMCYVPCAMCYVHYNRYLGYGPEVLGQEPTNGQLMSPPLGEERLTANKGYRRTRELQCIHP